MNENLKIHQLNELIGGYEGAVKLEKTLLDEVENGEIAAIKFKAILQLAIDTLTAVKDSTIVRKSVIDEIDREGGEVKGAYFVAKKGEYGVKYDYSGCGFSEWSDAKQEEDKAKAKRTEAEALLKAHKDSWVCESTGEVIYPPVKTSTTNVAITIKKQK